MGNLIKMDLRRMLHSPMFFISLSVVAAFNIILNVVFTLLSKVFVPTENATMLLSNTIATPFFLTFFIILMFASVVTFTYADIANGYIKNIAGQLPNKGILIVSKFIVVGIHNLMFLAVGSLTNLMGYFILSAMGMVTLTDDGHIGAAIMTLLLKWLLSWAISAILLFVTNGIRNKVLASIVGVIVGTGSLGLAYMGLNMAIANVFHAENFNLADYMPDSLINTVNVPAGTAVVNAIIVSAVCIAIFLTLTIKVFNSRDVK